MYENSRDSCLDLRRILGICASRQPMANQPAHRSRALSKFAIFCYFAKKNKNTEAEPQLQSALPGFPLQNIQHALSCLCGSSLNPSVPVAATDEAPPPPTRVGLRLRLLVFSSASPAGIAAPLQCNVHLPFALVSRFSHTPPLSFPPSAPLRTVDPSAFDPPHSLSLLPCN